MARAYLVKPEGLTSYFPISLRLILPTWFEKLLQRCLKQFLAADRNYTKLLRTRNIVQHFSYTFHKPLVGFHTAIFSSIQALPDEEQGDYIKMQDTIWAILPQSAVCGRVVYQIYAADIATSGSIFTNTFAAGTSLLATRKYPATASNDLQLYPADLAK